MNRRPKKPTYKGTPTPPVPGKPAQKPKDPMELITEYWKVILGGYFKSLESFDTTIITLSSGSLAVTMTFVKDIIGDDPVNGLWLLKTAWVVWGAGFVAILVSFLTSNLAMKNTLKKLNAAIEEGKAIKANALLGGAASDITQILNIASLILYIAGLVLFLYFVVINWN